MNKNLANDESTPVDLGNSTALTITCRVAGKVEVHVDRQLPSGQWSSVANFHLKGVNDTWTKTKVELGHEHVRVGVHGPDDGQTLINVNW